MLHWISLAILALLVLVTAGAGLWISQLTAAKNALAEALPGEHGAVVAYTIDAHGEPVDDGRAVFLNADSPLVVASVMKVVVLAAYEQAVEQGALDPAEQIPLAELERYYLPGSDGGAHAAGLASIGLRADSLGFAADPQAGVPLDTIATWMIHYSGNAETDYLIARLNAAGPDRLSAVLTATGMRHTAPVRPILGISLAMLNHQQPLVSAEQRQALLRQVASGDFSTLEALAGRYLTDPDWRAAQIAWMQTPAFKAAVDQMGWDGQVESAHLFPSATARDYAALMARTAAGAGFWARMRQKLETVPSDQPLRLLFHRTYGAKDGLTAGVIALASYAVPQRGPLAGQARVVVVIANDLSPQAWSAAVQSQSVYLLQPDLAAASGAYQTLAARP